MTRDAIQWGSGYVTDIAYMPGYYRQQAPSMMALACLLGGVASPMPGPDHPVTYLELGCGQGFGALLLAASNPSWTVTAVDFNPAHIAEGRSWAAAAKLANIRFIEADFATLAETEAGRAIPEADFASLHGVWTWVPPTVQAGIVRLLRAKIRPGGAVHVSYNALPGWAGGIGLQRVLREAGRKLAWRSDRQAEAGLKVVQDLHSAGAVQIQRAPMAANLLEHLDKVPVAYLSHEYMNDSWSPAFHADVARALSEAKLDWVAASQLVENFPELALTEEQRAIYHRFEDPLTRELVKDMCLSRTLRHDVFVRGPRRIDARSRDAALMQVWLTLNVPPQDMPVEVEMPVGRAELASDFYGPVAHALGDGPQQVGSLLNLPALSGRKKNPAELVGILAGLGIAEPVQRPGREPGAAARRFNQVAAATLVRPETLGRMTALASELLGAGAPANMLDLFVADRINAGESRGHIPAWVAALGAEADETSLERLRGALTASFDVRMPLLRRSGAI